MHEIKSFKIFQTAKVIAVLYAVLLIIVAVFEFAFFMHVGPRRPPAIAILVMPVIGTIFSFLSTAFLCWLYNLIAPSIGGIAFELTPRGEN